MHSVQKGLYRTVLPHLEMIISVERALKWGLLPQAEQSITETPKRQREKGAGMLGLSRSASLAKLETSLQGPLRPWLQEKCMVMWKESHLW